MYGAMPPKMNRPNPQGDDPNVEMQPLMVDPYFDQSFSPEPSTFSAFKLAAVVTTIAIILVIGIAVSARGMTDERTQNEKTDPFYVNKLSKMMMPNGWIRLRAATTASSKYNSPTGYIFLSQYEYGGSECNEDSLQIQHGTVTGVCVAGQDIYGEMSTSGVYSCTNDKHKVIWEFEQFNSTDCTGETLKVEKYDYPLGCNKGDKVDENYVFQAGCTKSNVPPYNDITKDGYLLGSAITDAKCDAGDEFYYSWVKTNTCLKGLDDGNGSRKFTECSDMAVTVSLFSDPECKKEEYSSATSFECDVTDDYFYYYYDDAVPDSKDEMAGADDAAGTAVPASEVVDDDGPAAIKKDANYYGDDDEADDKKKKSDDEEKSEIDGVEADGDDKARRRLNKDLLAEYKQFSLRRKLADASEKDAGAKVEEKTAPIIDGKEDDDDGGNNDDLAIFRNFVFGKCLSKGHSVSVIPPGGKAPVAVTRRQ